MGDLTEMQEAAHAQSRRWFPELHRDKKTEVVHFALGLAGEVGEVVNIVKKWHRGDYVSIIELEAQVGDELADVQIYLMDLAQALGVDLAEEVELKTEFNEKRFGGHRQVDLPLATPEVEEALRQTELRVGQSSAEQALENTAFEPSTFELQFGREQVELLYSALCFTAEHGPALVDAERRGEMNSIADVLAAVLNADEIERGLG